MRILLQHECEDFEDSWLDVFQNASERLGAVTLAFDDGDDEYFEISDDEMAALTLLLEAIKKRRAGVYRWSCVESRGIGILLSSAW
jgi:hypothetical protein